MLVVVIGGNGTSWLTGGDLRKKTLTYKGLSTVSVVPGQRADQCVCDPSTEKCRPLFQHSRVLHQRLHFAFARSLTVICSLPLPCLWCSGVLSRTFIRSWHSALKCWCTGSLAFNHSLSLVQRSDVVAILSQLLELKPLFRCIVCVVFM